MHELTQVMVRAVSTEFLTQVMARFPSGPQEMTKLPLEHVRDWASEEKRT